MRNMPGRNRPFSMSVTQLCERKNSSLCLSEAICRLMACTARVDKPSFSRHALSCLPASKFTPLTVIGAHPTPRVNLCPATYLSHLYRTVCARGENLRAGRKCGQWRDCFLLETNLGNMAENG